MSIKFSVIIPAYNAEKYIGESIETALLQKKVNHEVIVIDDGSSDNTGDIVKSFGARVSLYHQQNSGVSAARNYGATVAAGNVLAFLDSDDLWLPEKLFCQEKILSKGCQIVYTNRYNFGDIGDLPYIQTDVVEMRGGDLWYELLLGNMITTSSVSINKSLFQRLCGFDERKKYCEDWDLWLRCAENFEIGYCPTPLVKYRLHSAGISNNFKSMNKMRIEVVLSALKTARGQALTRAHKRKVLSKVWATCGWEAAKGKNICNALKCYGIGLSFQPSSMEAWYNLARVLCGRI